MCGTSKQNLVTTLGYMKQIVNHIRESRFYWSNPDRDIDHTKEWAQIDRMYDTLSSDEQEEFNSYLN